MMSRLEVNRSRPRRGSLFLRTAAYSALVTILTLGAFVLRFILHEREVLYNHLRDRAETVALALDSVAAQAFGDGNFAPAVAQAVRMVHADDDVLYVVFTPRDGLSYVQLPGVKERRVLDRSWRPGETELLEGLRESVLVEGEVFYHTRPITLAKEAGSGWLHVGISTQKYREGVRSLLQIVLDLAGPGLLIGFLTSFIFANRLTRPIGELKRFAQRVASGDLESSVRIESNTELGLLGDSMNQMVDDLRQSRLAEKESMEKETRLREQEILLKEIHHRVKNNLQILSSLLRMQARRASSEEMKGMLKESESRIRSMGLIHEKLYQSRSLSTVDFKSYVENLAGQLVEMHEVEDQRVDLEVAIEDVELPLDTAMPCGLIINELVSNSLKYAFADGRDGRISIRVDPEDERYYRLRVSDNGVGVPLPNPGSRRNSLGLNLVEMLVEQLNGSLEYRNGDGITADIRFEEIVYQNRMS